MSSAFFCLFTGYPPRAVTGILGWDGKWSPHMPLKMPLNVLVLLCDFSGLTPYPEHHLFKLIQHQDKQSKNCWPMIPKFSKGKRLLDETDCSSAFPFLFPFLRSTHSFFFKFNLYCTFPLPFSLLIPPSPSSHHTVVHVHNSFFLFAQSLHPLTPPPLAVICSPSMSQSLFCLFIQFVH